MADQKLENALGVSAGLIRTKKIAGQVVRETIDFQSFSSLASSDEEGLDALMAGIDDQDIEQGRKRLAVENPQAASQHMNDYLEEVAGSINFEESDIQHNPVREASIIRIGKLMDNETGDTIIFRRINANSQVELTAEDGEILDTLASHEFDELVESGSFTII